MTVPTTAEPGQAGSCLDYQYTDQASCEAGDPGYTSWVPHPAGASKALPMPKQLPCVECHAKIDAVGNTSTIYRKKIDTQVDPYGTYGGWVRTETGHIANTVDHVCSDDNYTTQSACDPISGHSWYEPLGVCDDSAYDDRTSCEAQPNHHWETPCSDNTYDDQGPCEAALETWEGTQHQWYVIGGNIQDYGACIFCHKMRPYHAYPGPPPDDPNTDVIDQDFYDDDYADPPHFPCVRSRYVWLSSSENTGNPLSITRHGTSLPARMNTRRFGTSTRCRMTPSATGPMSYTTPRPIQPAWYPQRRSVPIRP